MRTSLTEEHKERIRLAAKKRKHPEEVKKKISERMLGNKNAVKKVSRNEE